MRARTYSGDHVEEHRAQLLIAGELINKIGRAALAYSKVVAPQEATLMRHLDEPVGMHSVTIALTTL